MRKGDDDVDDYDDDEDYGGGDGCNEDYDDDVEDIENERELNDVSTDLCGHKRQAMMMRATYKIFDVISSFDMDVRRMHDACVFKQCRPDVTLI